VPLNAQLGIGAKTYVVRLDCGTLELHTEGLLKSRSPSGGCPHLRGRGGVRC
jgi:hypothetical protein